MNLTWEQGRLAEVAVLGTAARSTVRDSLWVSLMPVARSLDAALEDRLLGFPRRPAAEGVPQAATGRKAVDLARSKTRAVDSSADDLAFIATGLSALAMVVYCLWQMCLAVG